ncbi:MAG: hypothetical protein ACXAC7_16580 [Candidatus Hodarchaeales archaeon]|jgi:hypothetical protein
MGSEDLKQIIDKKFDQIIQLIEDRLNSQQKILEQTLEEINRIKHFLGTLPIDALSSPLSISSKISSLTIPKMKESLSSTESSEFSPPLISTDDDTQALQFNVTDSESLEELKEYLAQVRQNIQPDIRNNQDKSYRTIIRLEKQLLTDYQSQNWSNYFYTSYLAYDALISYLSSYIKQKPDINLSLKERWKEIKVFGLPIDLQSLIFLDDLYKQGGQIEAKEKTASIIQSNLAKLISSFKLLFQDFHIIP